MGSGHDHGLSEIRHERPLWWALGLTGTFLVAEVIGGLLTNSLALLSDAAHMATDTAGLVIALVAVRLARRPPDARRTFGYARLEALGALANGVLLLGVAVYILWEAVGRFREPPPVAATGMLVIAVAGLLVNLIAMRLLAAGSSESLNVKGAYLEVMSDALASVGVVVAAIVILLTGWTRIDALVSIAIALFMIPRTLILLRSSLSVLLETAPRDLDLDEVRAALLEVDGVVAVHDLHAWVITSGMASLSAHVEVADDPFRGDLGAGMLAELRSRVQDRFEIVHTTFQLECTAYTASEPPTHP